MEINILADSAGLSGGYTQHGSTNQTDLPCNLGPGALPPHPRGVLELYPVAGTETDRVDLMLQCAQFLKDDRAAGRPRIAQDPVTDLAVIR